MRGTRPTEPLSWPPRKRVNQRCSAATRSGADPNLRTKRNESALADAATAGNEEAVKLLFDRGAEINVQDIRGYTPLLYAAGSDTMPAAWSNCSSAKAPTLQQRATAKRLQCWQASVAIAK